MATPEAGLFGQKEVVDIAVVRWGPLARTWNRADGRCEVGLAGAGLPHFILGSADNWLDAARDAGLLESPEETDRIFHRKLEAYVAGK